MNKDKAIKKLYEIMYQYELSVLDGTGDYADEDAKESLKDNKECIEALKIAIKALS